MPDLNHYPAGDHFEVIEAGDSLGIYDCGDLRDATMAAINERAAWSLVIDMTRTVFLDATGLAVLVGALKRVRMHDGQMALACDYTLVLKVFSITGLDKLFTIRPTVAEAIETVREAARV